MNRHWWMAAVALVSSAPAMAQTAPAAAPAAATTAVPLDSARLAAARPVVDKLVPVGTYRRLMGSSFETMMKQMMGQMGDLPVAQIASLSGLSDDKVKALGDVSLNQIMAIYDPHWRERTDALMHAMTAGMGDLMDSMEPGVRAGLVRAYARIYTVDQLNEINRFFATPTGSLYAANSMPIFMDPEMIEEMQKMMPEIMKHMPEMIAAAAAKKANDALPPPRKLKDLSADERAKLAALLHVKPTELHDPQDGK